MGSPSAAHRATRSRERRWWPALVVTATILAVVVGGRLVRGTAPTPAAVSVGDVRIEPRPGWTLDRSEAAFARLHRGPVVLDVYATPSSYTGPIGVATTYVDQVLRPGLARLSLGEPVAATIGNGTPAVRVGYVGMTDRGVAIEGVVVAASGVRSSVLFDASAPQGALAAVARDVGAMIDGAVVGS
jgi:hypothetical protein